VKSYLGQDEFRILEHAHFKSSIFHVGGVIDEKMNYCRSPGPAVNQKTEWWILIRPLSGSKGVEDQRRRMLWRDKIRSRGRYFECVQELPPGMNLSTHR